MVGAGSLITQGEATDGVLIMGRPAKSGSERLPPRKGRTRWWQFVCEELP